MNSGQQFIIFDLKWFFNIIINILNPNETIKTQLDFNPSTNLTYLKNEYFKNPDFMDTFTIADAQQVEFIFDIIKSFNLIIKIENEKENFVVLPNYFTKEKPIFDLNLLWPKELTGCFQTTSVYEFYFDLPNAILTQIMSCFFKLSNVDYITSDCLLCNEGCFNILIQYEKAKSKFQNLN